MEPAHFFIKIRNFFDFYSIQNAKIKFQLFVQAFSDEALDLFLTLNSDVQKDMDKLESVFREYFKPQGHIITEIQNLLSYKKSDSQSVAEFSLQIKKKSREIKVDRSITEVAFVQGLSTEYQRHIAFRHAVTLEQMESAALEFEQLKQFDDAKYMTNNNDNQTDDQQLLEMISNTRNLRQDFQIDMNDSYDSESLNGHDDSTSNEYLHPTSNIPEDSPNFYYQNNESHPNASMKSGRTYRRYKRKRRNRRMNARHDGENESAVLQCNDDCYDDQMPQYEDDNMNHHEAECNLENEPMLQYNEAYSDDQMPQEYGDINHPSDNDTENESLMQFDDNNGDYQYHSQDDDTEVAVMDDRGVLDIFSGVITPSVYVEETKRPEVTEPSFCEPSVYGRFECNLVCHSDESDESEKLGQDSSQPNAGMQVTMQTDADVMLLDENEKIVDVTSTLPQGMSFDTERDTTQIPDMQKERFNLASHLLWMITGFFSLSDMEYLEEKYSRSIMDLSSDVTVESRVEDTASWKMDPSKYVRQQGEILQYNSIATC